MALGSGHVTTTTNTSYRPTIVSEWVVRARTANFVMKDLVIDRSQDVLDYGQAITINTSTVSAVQAKSANTEITVVAPTESTYTLTVNKHYVAAELIEDVINKQSKINLFKEKRWAIGKALAKQIDTDLLTLVASLSDNEAEGTGGSGNQLGKTNLINAIRRLDDADAPREDRFYIMTPNQKNGLLNNPDFTVATSIAYLKNDSPLVKGEFSVPILGLRLFTTSNIYTATNTKYNCVFQKEAFACAMQIDPKYEESRESRFVGTLLLSQALYGVAEIRDNHAVRMLE